MQRMKLILIAMRIEYLWVRIGRNRKKLEKLLDRKTPYTSPALFRLDWKTQAMGWQARKLESEWRELAGI